MPNSRVSKYGSGQTIATDDSPSTGRQLVEWTTPTRAALRQAKAITLRKKGGITCRQLFKQLDIPRSTAYRILKSDTSRCTGKTRSGRPYKLTWERVEELLKWITAPGHFDRRVMYYDDLIIQFNLPIGNETLLKEFARHGYYRCRACWGRYLKPEV